MTVRKMNKKRFSDEEAEKIRKRYTYRKLIQSGKLVLPHKEATALLGPDTAYHLYRITSYTSGKTVKSRKKTSRSGHKSSEGD